MVSKDITGQISYFMEKNRCDRCSGRFRGTFIVKEFNSEVVKSKDKSVTISSINQLFDGRTALSFNKKLVKYGDCNLKVLRTNKCKLSYNAFSPLTIKFICSKCNGFKHVQLKDGQLNIINAPYVNFSLLKTSPYIYKKNNINLYRISILP